MPRRHVKHYHKHKYQKGNIGTSDQPSCYRPTGFCMGVFVSCWMAFVALGAALAAI